MIWRWWRSTKTKNLEIGLIVAADEPALFFSSPEAATKALEAIDVRNGVYTASWNPSGQPYQISAVADQVIIVPDHSRQPDPEALRTVLLDFCAAAGVPIQATDSNVELLERCRSYVLD